MRCEGAVDWRGHSFRMNGTATIIAAVRGFKSYSAFLRLPIISSTSLVAFIPRQPSSSIVLVVVIVEGLFLLRIVQLRFLTDGHIKRRVPLSRLKGVT